MRGKLLNDFQRHRSDVGAHQRGLNDVHRMADAGGKHFRFKLVVAEYLDDLFDEQHAVGTDIIEPADERADEGRARFGGKQRLARREDERRVGANALRGKGFDCLDAVERERTFNDDVFMQRGEFFAFDNHLVGFERGDFGADGTVDELADAFDVRLEIVVIGFAFFGDERRIGSHAVQHAEAAGFLDFLKVRRINEKFHAEVLVETLMPQEPHPSLRNG